MKKYIILILINLLFISCDDSYKIDNLENSKFKKDDIIKIRSRYYLINSFDPKYNQYFVELIDSEDYSNTTFFLSARYVHNNATKLNLYERK